MKNLIMADLKVLGHRIWMIPLITLILVTSMSLIPFVNMPEPVRNFIITLLSPCFLIFELLREDRKHNSDSAFMALPLSKRTYVLSKYITIAILCVTALPVAYLSDIIIKYFGTNPSSGAVSLLPGFLNSIFHVLIVSYFFFPIYFLTKKVKTSFTVGVIFFWFIILEVIMIIYDNYHASFMTDNIGNFYTSLITVLLFAASINLVIKYYFRTVPTEWIRTGWSAAILLILIASIELLMRNLDHTYVYTGLLQNIGTHTGAEKERLLTIIYNYKYYISVFSSSIILCLTALFILRKKSNDMFSQNCVLYSFSPIAILIVYENIFRYFIKPFFDDVNIYLANTFDFQGHQYALMIGIVLSFAVSAKFSIYLLKNNRTLK